MKHAEIFTRLAQRADPNIPILEAAMEEIARLEEKLETSGYSPFTEEVEDILRSKNQNLFNALMESTKRTDEQTAEISRLKGVIAKCEDSLSKAIDARISTLRNADPSHDGYYYKTDKEVAALDSYTLPMLEALASIKEIDHA